MAITDEGPQFAGGSLSRWAVADRLPWLVERLGLTAGAICGSVPEPVRRKALGLGNGSPLPAPIDWGRNGIVISPPGTGKGMAIFVEALAHYERVFVLVPSVIQAHKLEESLDVLYNEHVGGCATSQRKAPGLIRVITTGIFHMLVNDPKSDLWKQGSVLCVDEAQRILEQDLVTEFMIGFAAHRGVPVMAVSATIAPGRLPQVYGHGADPAAVYELQQQMHPVDIEVLVPEEAGKELEVLSEIGALSEDGATSLIFAPSRRWVMQITKALRKAREERRVSAWVVPVTGAHVVEDQLEQIRRAQSKNKPVVVVATPGTMDSSVTIPGLTTVVILDRRVRVDWNEYGVRERWTERLPINHIWQMVRRVGRQAREDGKKDKVYVISGSGRADILAETPTFDPITGCSPHTPLEGLLLEAVLLNVPFSEVGAYMVSRFSEARVREAVEALLAAEMIRRTNDENDPDGFVPTEKGQIVAAMPYDYKWSRLIVEAPEHLRPYLTLIASFGRLENLEAYERDDEDEEGEKSISELLMKLELGRDYLAVGHDHAQYAEAGKRDLSFRRLEQMETLFELGCEAFDLPAEVPESTTDDLLDLVHEIVTGGLRVGLFGLYLPGKGPQGWSDPRKTAYGKIRRFFPSSARKLALDEYAKQGITAVVATPTWFTTAKGAPCGNLDDVTIIPDYLIEDLVREMATREGWFELTFEEVEHRGRTERQAVKGGVTYIASRLDQEPVVGRPYWCSIDREFGRWTKSVIVHYPVD